jgi:hypothetical protein
VSLNNTANASSAVAGGALTVAGGAAIAKMLYVGQDANLKAALNVDGDVIMESTLRAKGAATFDGAASVGGVLSVSGASNLNSTLNVTGAAVFSNNVTVNGNMLVTGTTTTVNSEVVSIKDAAILIANNNETDAIQAGIQIKYKPDPAGDSKFAGLKRMPGTGEFVFFSDADMEIESFNDPANGAVQAYAPVLADSFNSASDARLKNQIVNLDGALDKIDNIRGVYHHWIHENQPQERQIGVIAQEVEAIYPELVNHGGNGYLSVNYPKLTAVLLQSIKDLKAIVMDLVQKQQ